MKEIKKYIVGFIIGILSVGSISYAADSGSIGVLFEKVGSNWKLLGDNIKDDTVDSSEIEDSSLTSDDLGSNSVGTDEVALDSLTALDLASNSVGSSELVDNPTFINPKASNPTQPNHVATKEYVDSKVGSSVLGNCSVCFEYWDWTGASEYHETCAKLDGSDNNSGRQIITGDDSMDAYNIYVRCN